MPEQTANRRTFIKSAAALATASVIPATARAKSAEPKSNPYKYKISCAGYGYRKYLSRPGHPGPETIFDFVDLCAKWGCDATEPTTYYFTQNDPEYLHRLKRQAFLLNLDVSSTAINNNFFWPAGDQLEKELAHVRAWIDRAVLIGAPVIRIFAGRGRKGLTREDAIKYCIDPMKRACDYAGEKGVFLGVENHGYGTETGEALLEILDKVNHPWLGINLDTGNFPDHAYRNIEIAAPKAITCQVKVEVRESDKGKVPADLSRIVDILRKADYRGYLVLEYESHEDPKVAIPKYIQRLREIAS